MSNKNTTYCDAQNKKKLQLIPKSKQLTSNEPIVTYKLYCGFFLGVNFDIQTVLLNFQVSGSSAGHLQYVKFLGVKSRPQDMEL